jgi:hypothetical protein
LDDVGLYAKSNYGLSERLYGFIPMTNAIMVILFQVLMTAGETHNAKGMMRWALLLWNCGSGVAFSQGFWDSGCAW